jgi:hypothetical protein
MNSRETWQTINPSPEEMHAATAAFGELPKMDVLARLIMVRRAVAAGFYTDQLPSPASHLLPPSEQSDTPLSQLSDSER